MHAPIYRSCTGRESPLIVRPETPYTEWSVTGFMNRTPETPSSKLGKFDRTVSMEMTVPDNTNGVLFYEYNLFEVSRTKIGGNRLPLADYRCPMRKHDGMGGR